LSDVSTHLAANLRYLRERRGLTQARLATLCDVPRSTIAHLETGSANPTLSVLTAVADALQLTIEELLSPPRARIEHHPAHSLPVRERGRGGSARVHVLLPDPLPGTEIDRVVYAPGARMTGIPHRPGTREYLYCERGAITLRVLGDRVDLADGDVATFPGDQPHSYQNAFDGETVAFSVVTLAPVG